MSSPSGFGNESGHDGSLAVGTDSVETTSAELDVESSDGAELLSVCTSGSGCAFTDDTTTPSDFWVASHKGIENQLLYHVSSCVSYLFYTV